ncbi:MAG: YicC family protein [Archangium sp.]|nr:YicC family protein [Archangium sp.]
MLKSMTGFGTGRATAGGESLTVELRSVNHKFCEVKARLPRELSTLEPLVAKLVKDRVARGAVDVAVKRSTRAGMSVVPIVDLALAQAYRKAFAQLAQTLGVPDETSVRDIATQPNVVRLEEPEVNLEDAAKALEIAVLQAIDALGAMRTKEGTALRDDVASRLAAVDGWTTEVTVLAPKAVEQWRDRLATRAAELSKGLPVDPQRLAQEVALFAERTDVAEELTRLASHQKQFQTLLAATEPVGRKMDFLVQEMHREVNTTGSKSQHAEISNRVMQMKSELERIREQVQNIE